MIRDRDRGARKLVRTVGDMRAKAAVDVGVIGSDAAAEKEPGITVADVATWAEFGIGQPQRSWLRGWIEENESAIKERISKETRAVISGKRTHKQALARIGVWAVGEIQKRIANRIPPPNAPSTIARKGSSTPLIDKGQLRSSITSKVHENGVGRD